MVKDVAVTDAAGERNYKLVGATISVSQNGNSVNAPVFDQQTLYASPLITITDKGYTKHYFEEGNRICSSIGSGGFSNIFQHTSPIVSDLKEINRKTNQNAINTYKNNIGVTPYIDVTSIYPYIFYHRSTLYKSAPEAVFYYHTDHLGSATLVTDDAADVVQQIAYLPYGEDWVDIRSNGYFGSAYKFNGKEKDDETGYSYYGARYYTDRLSIWLSVDPLADKYPHLSPYAYCADNPVIFRDPDGRKLIPSSEFLASLYGTVYTKLLSNKGYKNMLSGYWEHKIHNLNFNVATGTSTTQEHLYAYTEETSASYTNKEGFAMYNSNALYFLGEVTNKNQHLTEIGKATIIVHEGLHSALQLSGLDNADTDDHNDFSNNLSIMKDILQEYSSNNNLNYSDKQINDLVHSGLPENNAIFKQYVEQSASNQNWSYNKKLENYKERVQKLMWEKNEE